MNAKQWNDVADLLNEFATACETEYEEHDKKAKKHVARLLMNQSMRAQRMANRKTEEEAK